MSRSASRERLHHLLGRCEDGGWCIAAVARLDDDICIGITGLLPANGVGPEVELAYHIVPSAWGRGYATEAASALIAAAFSELELEEIIAMVHPAHTASIRVLEKLRMQQRGQISWRGDVFQVFAVLRLHRTGA